MFELSTYKRLLKQEEINCLECPSHKGGVGVKMTGTQLAQDLSITDQNTINWLNNNLDTANRINDYLQQNNNSEEAKVFARAVITIFSEPELDSNYPQENYTSAILKMTNHLKQWGNPEDEYFAEYIELVVPDFPSMTIGDVYDIYKLVRDQVHKLTIKYLRSIVTPFAEAAYPFVVYAITEATLGAALSLISRIPLSMVSRGVRLEEMVRQAAKLGSPGTGSHIRIIPNGSYTKTLKFFNKLSQNSISVTTETLSDGRIRKVANMGNGNYITFRNYDHSKTQNLVANIDLNFSSIWSKIRELKFIK